jgi:hypothetical protein
MTQWQKPRISNRMVSALSLVSPPLTRHDNRASSASPASGVGLASVCLFLQSHTFVFSPGLRLSCPQLYFLECTTRLFVRHASECGAGKTMRASPYFQWRACFSLELVMSITGRDKTHDLVPMRLLTSRGLTVGLSIALGLIMTERHASALGRFCAASKASVAISRKQYPQTVLAQPIAKTIQRNAETGSESEGSLHWLPPLARQVTGRFPTSLFF